MDNGPGYEELRTASPDASGRLAELSPVAADGRLDYTLVPSEMTEVATPILVVCGRRLATGSHESAAAWSMLAEARIAGRLAEGQAVVVAGPAAHGLGAAWAAFTLGHPCTLVLPEGTHRSTVDAAKSLNASVECVAGDAVDLTSHADGLAGDGMALSAWVELAPWRYHAEVTGRALVDLAEKIAAEEHVARGKVDALIVDAVSPGMTGVASTVARSNPDALIALADSAETPRLPAWNDDLSVLTHRITVPDEDSCRYLQLLEQEYEILVEEAYVPMEPVDDLLGRFGFTAMRNILAGVKLARDRGLDHTSLVVAFAPQSFRNEAAALEERWSARGAVDFDEGIARMDILRNVAMDGIEELGDAGRARMEEERVDAWCERGGRDGEEAAARAGAEFWSAEARRAAQIDAARG